jgi:hypothetical protein
MDDLVKRLRAAGRHPMMDNTCKVGVFDVNDAADRIAELEALLEEAKEVIRFYADEHRDGYDIQIVDYGLNTECGHVINDDGNTARTFLARLENSETE